MYVDRIPRPRDFQAGSSDDLSVSTFVVGDRFPALAERPGDGAIRSIKDAYGLHPFKGMAAGFPSRR